MRVAVTTASRRRIGGAETYVEDVVRRLHAMDCPVLLWHEIEGPADRPPIALPHGVETVNVEELGGARAIDALRRWQPDVIYSQGLLDPGLESECASVAPAVAVIHSYVGSCISGTKTHSFPKPIPCHRPLGPGCLLYYFPRRCGGWSPVSMVQHYRQQRERKALLGRYPALMTFSEHMRQECIRQGLDPERIVVTTYPLDSEAALQSVGELPSTVEGGVPEASRTLRLLFIGRAVHLKGAHYLLDALPRVASALNRPVHLTIAGDGPERPRWEERAATIARQHPSIEVSFAGWVDQETRDALLEEADLLVVPSLWPEPFGIVGLEAGRMGVPSVAFDVGGVRSWLEDGVSGELAPGDPPTVAGLAAAIERAVRDPRRLHDLGREARIRAARFSAERHFRELSELLASVASNHGTPGAAQPEDLAAGKAEPLDAPRAT
ncbi:MAG TPA: glycosyltransferase family 4 protein [Gemmatimonadaceae bacterium]|nr:glycosyltransferase family 4 protein [Gemmatimonadaceae bacterium]